MTVGSRKYGLRWRMPVEEPWVVIHGDQVGGCWVHLTREDMVKLWKAGNSVGGINEWMAGSLCEGRYCKIGEKFSEMDLM